MKTIHGARFALALSAAIPAAIAGPLETEFLTPPDASRPGVYWTSEVLDRLFLRAGVMHD